MPKIYKRNCDYCGDSYEGYGEKYCSPECANIVQKKEAEEKNHFEDIPPKNEKEVNKTEEDGKLMVSVKARKADAIKTLEKLLEICEVDTDKWEVEKYEARTWNAFYKDDARNRAVTVPMFSISARFKPRDGIEFKNVINRAIENMEKHSPTYTNIPKRSVLPSNEQHLLELYLPDLHLGLLSWKKETGENYDSEIAIQRYTDAIDNLLKRSQIFGVEKTLLVVGSDFFHTDKYFEGKGGTTTAGTPQDVDSRRDKMIQRGCDLMVDTIDRILGVSPVDVVVVPGNHDQETSLHLGRYLKAWYRNVNDVSVDAEPKTRKYYNYGNVLLGLAHGQDEKTKDLPLIMATEKPQEWARSTFREWRLGHQHRKKEYQALYVNEEQGVRIRILPALTGVDAWHFKKGYTQNQRGAEAFIWHPEKGLQVNFHWNLL